MHQTLSLKKAVSELEKHSCFDSTTSPRNKMQSPELTQSNKNNFETAFSRFKRAMAVGSLLEDACVECVYLNFQTAHKTNYRTYSGSRRMINYIHSAAPTSVNKSVLKQNQNKMRLSTKRSASSDWYGSKRNSRRGSWAGKTTSSVSFPAWAAPQKGNEFPDRARIRHLRTAMA